MDRLGKDVVHEICTNQVVVTLQACVKELVENSLDAGATRIEVRLRESGSELLEVVDNGRGITAEDYEKVATRHATSKIREYDDLSQNLSTFGFRGEALSAICAMGDMTISTKTAADSCASLIAYDRFGKLSSSSPAAREVGTTVSVRELFKRLPVRHKEFMRNAKSQVSATLRLIQSYAIAQPEIRFTVVAEKVRGHGAGRATLLCTSGSARGWKQSAAAVLGDAAVVDVKPLEVQSATTGWAVSGLISSPTGGRRTRDSQLYFVNRRPIDPPKRIAKLINDTYHQYNSRSWPVVLLSFSAAQGLVDVNVTPDKKTVFLHNEEALLADLQQALTELYSSTAQGPGASLSDFGIVNSSKKRAADRSPLPVASASDGILPVSQAQVSEILEAEAKTPPPPGAAQRRSPAVPETPEKSQALTPALEDLEESTGFQIAEEYGSQASGVQGGFAASASGEDSAEDQEEPSGFHIAEEYGNDASGLQGSLVASASGEDSAPSASSAPSAPSAVAPRPWSQSLKRRHSETDASPQYQVIELVATEEEAGAEVNATSPEVSTQAEGMSLATVTLPGAQDDLGFMVEEFVPVPVSHAENCAETQADSQASVEDEASTGLPAQELPAMGCSFQASATLAGLGVAIERKRRRRKLSQSAAASQPSEPSLHFPSAFSLAALQPGAAKGASSSLEEVAKFATSDTGDEEAVKFDKTCFSQMRVIGQFNLGFIIAALRSSSTGSLQLFIVDQHASDEKFRFEALNRESKIDRQPLVNPHQLQLSPAQEQLAEAHLEVFRLNGFELLSDETKPPGRRLRVATLPTCQGLVFNERDIQDLLYKLEEAEAVQRKPDSGEVPSGGALLDLDGHRALWSATAIPRPHKVWQLLASRACRYAIMIGKALRVSEMEKVLSNLGTLRQPWNCPHGRPTMRHLVDTGAARKAPHRGPALAELLAGGAPK